MRNNAKLVAEKNLAVAHRALWRAAQHAEILADQGLCDDIYALCFEVGRVNESLLRSGGPYRRLPELERSRAYLNASGKVPPK